MLPKRPRQLALLSSRERTGTGKIADYLEAQTDDILRANAEDLAEARANGLSEAMLDRLALTPARLSGIASDVRPVCNLADPVGGDRRRAAGQRSAY